MGSGSSSSRASGSLHLPQDTAAAGGSETALESWSCLSFPYCSPESYCGKEPKAEARTALQLVAEMYLPVKLFPGRRVFPSSFQTVRPKSGRRRTQLMQCSHPILWACLLLAGSGPQLPGTFPNFQGCFISSDPPRPLPWRPEGHLVLRETQTCHHKICLLAQDYVELFILRNSRRTRISENRRKVTSL